VDARTPRERRGARARLIEPLLQRARERIGLAARTDQRAERADHVEDPRDVAVVERMHRDAAADQLGGNVGLQVGEGEHEVGVEREHLLEIGGDERRHPRLLLAHPRRPDRIARHADDAALLAEEIKRLHGLLGQADDALGREHDSPRRPRASGDPSCHTFRPLEYGSPPARGRHCGVAERACAYSDSAMGALNSEVAPSLEVTVAVNDAGTAPGASTVSAKTPAPSASVVLTVSPRKISPSPLPLSRLPNTSTVRRARGVPRSRPCTASCAPLLRTLSSVGAAMARLGAAWQLGAPS